MAIITSIQKRAYILVLVIAVALIAFLFEIIFPNLNSFSSNPTYIGKVNGHELSYEEFTKEFEAKQAELSQAEGRSLTEDEINGLKDQIWSNFLVNNSITSELEKGGFEVTDAELVEITTGTHIDPTMTNIPAFKSKDGKYDPIIFKNFLRTLNQDEPGMPPGTKMQQWLEFEKQLIRNRRVVKFNSIMTNGIYVPKWLMSYEKSLYASQSDIDYVHIPYPNLDSTDIKIDEDGLQQYFEEHRAAYTPVYPTVDMVTAAFRLTPSSADSIDIMKRFDEKLEKLNASKDDTTFFRAYGDKGFDTKYYTANDLRESPVGQNIFTSGAGTVIGPYLENEMVKATKVIRRKNIADSALVQMITISFRDAMQSQEAVTARMKVVDSIFKQLDTLHQDFNTIAQTASADRGAGLQPQWIMRQDKRWTSEIFDEGGTRKYFKVPSDQEAVVRIIKIVNFPANIPAVQLGEISVPYSPSTETQNLIYSNATKFLEMSNSAEDFEKNISKFPDASFGISEVTQSDRTLNNIMGNAREAIRWGFDSETGDKSSMFQIGSNYVVCLNEGLKSKDHLELNTVRKQVEMDYKVYLLKQQTAKKLEGNSLETIASNNGLTVDSIQKFSFSNPYINQSPEANLVAATSSLKAGQMTKPIEGNAGVYRAKVTKIDNKEISPSDELNAKMQLNRQMKSINGLLESMIDNADIVDNRINMF